MSKNKDIETLHRITGEPYRVCRARMKANNWELLAALGFYTIYKAQVALEALGESFRSLMDDMCEAFGSIDWAGLMEEALELKRQQDERLIQCNARKDARTARAMSRQEDGHEDRTHRTL